MVELGPSFIELGGPIGIWVEQCSLKRYPPPILKDKIASQSEPYRLFSSLEVIIFSTSLRSFIKIHLQILNEFSWAKRKISYN